MVTKKDQMQNIRMDLIDRPANPDRLSIDPDYIQELAASIASVGLLNPIVLCLKGGRFEIVAGDCRFMAFVSLGKTEIPAFIKDIDIQTISFLRAIENLQRRDLTIIEEARIYRTMHNDYHLSWDEIAKKTGKSAGNVKRRYELLKLPELLIKAMHERRLAYSIAEELAYLKDLGKIEYYLNFCLDHGATRAVVAGWVKEEQALARQKIGTGGQGDWGSAIPEQKPLYMSCDVCHGPVELGKEVGLRICEVCKNTIKQNM